MTKITKITTQKRNKNRYNVFLDKGEGETYGFSVEEDVLIEHQLKKGMELDEPTIESLIRKDTIHKSYTLSLNFLSFRMRSVKEMKDYLVKKEVDTEHITVVIERLLEEGLLNDKDFAEAMVRTRINTSSKGPLLVKKELIEKGVDVVVADESIQQYTYEEQYEKAMKWVNKKLKNDGRKSFRQQVQQVQQTLMQKGFSQEVVKDVMKEVQEEKDGDAEWEAVVYQGEKLLRKYSNKDEGNKLKQKMKASLYRKGFGFEYIERFLEEYVNENN